MDLMIEFGPPLHPAQWSSDNSPAMPFADLTDPVHSCMQGLPPSPWMSSSNPDDEDIMASATCKDLQKLVLQQLLGI